jgi:hypothetical protein
VVATHLAVERADEQAVQAQETDQQVAHRSAHRPRLGATLGVEGPLQTTVEVGAEFLVRRVAGRRERAHDEPAAGRQLVEAVAAQVPELTLDTMTEDGVADRSTDHETHPDRVGRAGRLVRVAGEQVHHEGVAALATSAADDQAQVVTPSEAMLRR